MRAFICGLVLALIAVSAEAQSFRAGVTRLAVADSETFNALVAYPTLATEATVELGPLTVSASQDAPVAEGGRFPVVLFSHGSGRAAGTPLLHRELLLHLAREGFFVVAPFHTGGKPFEVRPGQVRKALEKVLADARFAAHADAARVGMMGFSFGGAVTLLSAGAALDLAHLSSYCSQHRDDPRACDGIPTDGSWAGAPPRKSADAIGLKALVLLEPFGAPFPRNGLAAVDMPVLIYHAQHTDLRPDGNALALARALPRPPVEAAVPGGHFVFVDPCPSALQSQAPQICGDLAGVDRPAVLAGVRVAVAKFFREKL